MCNQNAASVAWMLNNLYQLKCMSDATGVRSCTPSRQLQTAAFQCLHIKRRPWPLVEISAKYGKVSSSCFFLRGVPDLGAGVDGRLARAAGVPCLLTNRFPAVAPAHRAVALRRLPHKGEPAQSTAGVYITLTHSSGLSANSLLRAKSVDICANPLPAPF